MSDDCPYVLIPCVKVTPSYMVLYNRCEWINPSKRKKRMIHESVHTETDKDKEEVKALQEDDGQKLIFPSSEAQLSPRTIAKIKKAISWLLFLANDKELVSSYHGKTFRYKVTFVTLTLSARQEHDDNEIKKKCLNQFLIEAKKKWSVMNYVWRAESQVNGNIHFHIITDKFIPWSELRDVWNRMQNKLGYVDRYRDEMRAFHNGGFQVRRDLLASWEYKKQIRAYEQGKKNDWNSPNSTDVHAVWKIKNLPAYMAKYCAKGQKYRKIEGNVWNLSETLSKLDGATAVMDGGMSSEITKLLAEKSRYVMKSDYYTIGFFSEEMLKTPEFSKVYGLLVDYVDEITGKWQ